MTKARTKRAAKQFKSPLSADSSSAVISSVRLTPTIQMLKRKVQVLKRAIKVKNDGDEKTLEKLVEKWTEAGREVAYGVWELVKDMGGDDTRARGSGGWGSDEWDGKGKGRNFKDSWGWNDKAERRGAVNETERNWGWVVSVDEKVDDGAGEDRSMEDSRGGSADKRWEKEGGPEEDEKRDTLGTMLKQLGIDPQTLGWDDEEGTFSGE
jgi:hypothetical protein